MWRSLSIAAVVIVAATACSTQSPSEIRAAEVYNAAIRWLATEHDDDPDPLRVYVEPRGQGAAIALDVQAEVVAASADLADVVFVDARDEALTQAEDGTTVVRDGGLLVRLGPVVEDGERVTLQIDRWTGDDRFTTYLFTVRHAGDVWEVANSPIETGRLVLDQ